MYVESRTSYEQPYKTDSVRKIDPDEWGAVPIETGTLRELVVQWLEESLPPNPKPNLPEGIQIVEL